MEKRTKQLQCVTYAVHKSDTRQVPHHRCQNIWTGTRYQSESTKESVSNKHDKDVKSQSGKWTVNTESFTGLTPRTSTGQLRLQEAFALRTKLTRTSARHTSITRAIGIFIAKDMRQFSVLENPGVVKLVHELEPRYDIPCRTHFSEKVIPKLYDETKSKVSEDLKQASFIALTTYSWTSRATQSYNTVTAHFIHDWEMKSCVLQTTTMDKSHTAENLSEFLLQVVADWNLRRNGELPALVIDNARNIINAGKIAGLHPHVGCFARYQPCYSKGIKSCTDGEITD